MWTDLQQSTQDIDGKQINNNEGQPDVFGFLTKEEKKCFFNANTDDNVGKEYKNRILNIYQNLDESLTDYLAAKLSLKGKNEDFNIFEDYINKKFAKYIEDNEIDTNISIYFKKNEEEKVHISKNYIKELIDENIELNSNINTLKLKLDHLNSINTTFKVPSVDLKHITRDMINNELTATIFNEMIDNLYSLKNAATYSDDTYKFCFILMCKSTKCYEHINKILPFPTVRNIQKHFRSKLISMKENLINLDNLDLILTDFTNLASKVINTSISANVGCDAAALALFKSENFKMKHEIDEDSFFKLQETFISMVNNNYINLHENICDLNVHSTQKSFFAFILEPNSPLLPIVILHISESNDGRVHQQELEKISIIFSKLKEYNIESKFIITDGETGMNKMHKIVFEKYKDMLGTYNLDNLMKIVEETDIWPVLDVLHGTKSARGRLVDNNICFWNYADLFNAEMIENRLNLGKPLTDKSKLGKMKDYYAIALFSMMNSLKEYSEGHVSSGIYLIIYSIILESFRNPLLSVELRIKFVDISLHLIKMFITLYDQIPKPSDITLRKTTRCIAVTFADRIALIKLHNTMLAVRYIILKYGDDLDLARITSQIVENFFGNYRENTSHYYTLETAQLFAARTRLSMEYKTELKIPLSFSSKDNLSGTKINISNDINLITDSNKLDSAFIAEVLFDISVISSNNWKNDEAKKVNFKTIFDWFIDIYQIVFQNCKEIPNIHMPSVESGRKILNRLININKS